MQLALAIIQTFHLDTNYSKETTLLLIVYISQSH